MWLTHELLHYMVREILRRHLKNNKTTIHVALQLLIENIFIIRLLEFCFFLVLSWLKKISFEPNIFWPGVHMEGGKLLGNPPFSIIITIIIILFWLSSPL